MATEEFKCPLRSPIAYITSHNEAGKAKVYRETTLEGEKFPQHGVILTPVYVTSTMPPDLSDDQDIAKSDALIASGRLATVNPNGSVCRIVDFAPVHVEAIHRTQSLDYGVVLEGSIIMDLDDGSKTLMKRGDIAVQRGTMHGWRNASKTEWARMLFVLQECKPLVVGGVLLGEEVPEGKEDVIRKN